MWISFITLKALEEISFSTKLRYLISFYQLSFSSSSLLRSSNQQDPKDHTNRMTRSSYDIPMIFLTLFLDLVDP